MISTRSLNNHKDEELFFRANGVSLSHTKNNLGVVGQFSLESYPIYQGVTSNLNRLAERINRCGEYPWRNQDQPSAVKQFDFTGSKRFRSPLVFFLDDDRIDGKDWVFLSIISLTDKWS